MAVFNDPTVANIIMSGTQMLLNANQAAQRFQLQQERLEQEVKQQSQALAAQQRMLEFREKSLKLQEDNLKLSERRVALAESSGADEPSPAEIGQQVKNLRSQIDAVVANEPIAGGRFAQRSLGALEKDLDDTEQNLATLLKGDLGIQHSSMVRKQQSVPGQREPGVPSILAAQTEVRVLREAVEQKRQIRGRVIENLAPEQRSLLTGDLEAAPVTPTADTDTIQSELRGLMSNTNLPREEKKQLIRDFARKNNLTPERLRELLTNGTPTR
jgi:hypothetical protein